MDTRYDHATTEDAIYQKWIKANAFVPTGNRDPKTNSSFTIMMPPPNANDPLHIGHAIFLALEDILIRFHRMRGDDTLWLPGTDHAGIETQFIFEKKLKKKGESRFNYDRETLYSLIWDYVQENSDVAVNQMKKIGASADWSRFRFMLDPKNVEVVLDTFMKLYQEKLVYRDLRLVNFCVHCGTAFSELEINHEQRISPFYKIKYGPFVIGTVRPETKFRDTALAVHPTDPRYKKFIGKSFEIMGLLGPVTMQVLADPEVDPEFGTGIMKVTPAHDAHDFELGKEFNLPVTPIIDFKGRMDFSWFIENPDNATSPYLERAKKYHGLKVAKMREVMKEDLEQDGLLDGYDPNYTHNLSVCYRCKHAIEPLPLSQFFISVKPLTKPILKSLKSGEVTVHGAGHDKILKHWLENLKDWNISRQIVWGIRMPIWYDTQTNPTIQLTFLNAKKEKVVGQLGELLQSYDLKTIAAGLQDLHAPVEATYQVSLTSPGDHFIQETDTFDTWFSSAQWPFSTLMSLSEADFQRFYPTQVMETGYDILPFWVMRMLMIGKFRTGQLPFTDVYLHGLARDQKGQKMSKSKGNVINPLESIDKYGADVLRMALVTRSSAGLDKSIGEADFKAMRNFTNKVWNASRFVLLLTENPGEEVITKSMASDQAFFDRLNALQQTVTQQILDFKLGLAADTLYNEFWHWFCDTCIEDAKKGKLSLPALRTGLESFLTLLHPFIPFITEEIWAKIRTQTPGENSLLITSPWPNEPVSRDKIPA